MVVYFSSFILLILYITFIDFEMLNQLCLLHLVFFFSFLAALGLCCCAQAFSSCGERGLLFIVVRGLLIAVVSLAAEHGL